MARANQRGPGGRPIRLTKTLSDTICRSIRSGSFQSVAFEAAGVPESTAYAWLRRGQVAYTAGDESEAEQPFMEFWQSLKKAVASSEQTALRRIQRSSHWQASAWYLERRFPERWALRSRIDSVAEQKSAALLDSILGAVSNESRAEIIAVLHGATSKDAPETPTPD
ncbi:hypothetical protein [Adonisia turfae]|nr:hypothetical protein [Adonisia turfae]